MFSAFFPLTPPAQTSYSSQSGSGSCSSLSSDSEFSSISVLGLLSSPQPSAILTWKSARRSGLHVKCAFGHMFTTDVLYTYTNTSKSRTGRAAEVAKGTEYIQYPMRRGNWFKFDCRECFARRLRCMFLGMFRSVFREHVFCYVLICTAVGSIVDHCLRSFTRMDSVLRPSHLSHFFLHSLWFSSLFSTCLYFSSLFSTFFYYSSLLCAFLYFSSLLSIVYMFLFFLLFSTVVYFS